MSEDNRSKPNYNDTQYNHEFNSNEQRYENQYDDSSSMPRTYNDRGYTDSFYYEEDSGTGSFLFGAIVGGVIGAAAALFLAPKTGKEMRGDFSTQAGNLKEKSIEISTVAKDKASVYSSVAKEKATEFTSIAKDKTNEFTSIAKDKTNEFTSIAKDKTNELSSIAKDKTDEVTKTIQKQSGQIIDKVKSMKAKNDESSEGEETIDFSVEDIDQVGENLEETTVSEALKEAVTEKQSTK